MQADAHAFLQDLGVLHTGHGTSEAGVRPDDGPGLEHGDRCRLDVAASREIGHGAVDEALECRVYVQTGGRAAWLLFGGCARSDSGWPHAVP